MDAIVSAGAGFLLAVLWFDLMFDVQLVPHRAGDVPDDVLASIAAYYRRVTTGARPMNRLIMLAMVATLVGIGLQSARDDAPRWVSAVSVVAAALPIGLAGARTVPSAVRLGARRDPVQTQVALARTILGDHRFCFASIVTLLVVQLAWA